MKLPFYFDKDEKRKDLNIKGLFKHCDELLNHLTPTERDQFRRYLTNEFKNSCGRFDTFVIRLIFLWLWHILSFFNKYRLTSSI